MKTAVGWKTRRCSVCGEEIARRRYPRAGSPSEHRWELPSEYAQRKTCSADCEEILRKQRAAESASERRKMQEEIVNLQDILIGTYKFEQGYAYLLCFNKNVVSRHAMEGVGAFLMKHGIRILTVGTMGEPFPTNVGLYRLQPPNEEETREVQKRESEAKSETESKRESETTQSETTEATGGETPHE